MENNFLFEKEIRIFGLRRSGLHATHGWISGHFKNNSYMYQDNTYLSFSEWKTDTFDNKFEALKNPKCYVNIIEQQRLPGVVNNLNNIDYKYNVQKKEIVGRYDKKYFSEKEYNIIVLRNPFNNLASRLMKLKHASHENFNPMWKAYANEFIGITNFFPYKTPVLFDEWFTNKEYRKNLSSLLGLKFSDKKLNTVSSQSSFDKFEFNNKAQEMNVLNRWDQIVLEKKEKYIYMLDEEIIDLWETVLKKTLK